MHQAAAVLDAVQAQAQQDLGEGIWPRGRQARAFVRGLNDGRESSGGIVKHFGSFAMEKHRC
jgi:hypothetical protein